MQIQELGHVVLYVSSLTKSLTFYRDVLGFTEIHHDAHIALFSSGRTHHELLLIQVGGSPKEKRYPEPGLYHIGFKIGTTTSELQNAYNELKQAGVPIVGATDHYVTHSLYILDPDGNELELYVDVNDDWKKDKMAIIKEAKRLYLK